MAASERVARADDRVGRARAPVTPALLALAVSLAGLAAGPLVVLGGRGRGAQAASGAAFFDALTVALVGGLVVVQLIPHALAHAGLWALLAGVVGAALPAADHALGPSSGASRAPAGGWRAAFPAITLLALSLHAAMDGAALALVGTPGGHGMGLALAVAIVAHRVPVGFAVASAAVAAAERGRALPGRAVRASWSAVGLLALATVAGFALGDAALGHVPDAVVGSFEGLVAGALLHVVLRREPTVAALPPPVSSLGLRFEAVVPAGGLSLRPAARDAHACDDGCHDHAPPPAMRAPAAVGGLLGAACVAGLTAFTHDPAASGAEPAWAFVHALTSLTLTSAPALLLGFVLAGVVHAVLDPARAGWLAGGTAGSQALRGVVFGLPLPVCSCGVVPLYRALVRGGVPATAGLAFLVATPELGLDAVMLSLPLLGAPMTLARVVAAFGVALAVAWMVGPGAPVLSTPRALHEDAAAAEDVSGRLVRGLRFGLVDVVDHTLPWVAVGLVIAALAEPLLDAAAVGSLPGWAQVPLLAVAGIPVYVCASGATPLAAVAVQHGVTSGAALAFLLAGPATNVTTFGVLAALHGRAVAWRFGLALTGMAVVAGYAVDLLGVTVPAWSGGVPAHDVGSAPLGALAAVALFGLGVASLFRQGLRGVLGQLLDPVHVHD